MLTTAASDIERTFFETNVLAYADDLDCGPKRATALAVIDLHIRAGTAVVSTQALQEFYAIATRKLGIAPDVGRSKVELLGSLDVVKVDVDIILVAIDLQRLHVLSFWDAITVRSAVVAGCSVLLTEDLQNGRTFGDLRIVNPFLA